MDAAARQQAITEYAESLIRYKAKRLSEMDGFNESDIPDIRQDLRLALIEAYPKYDAQKACLNTFAAKVIESKLASMIRFRQQECRDYRKEEYSLQEEMEDEDGRKIQRAADTDVDQCAIRRRLRAHTREQQARLKMDVDMVIAKLPNDLRVLAELLKLHTVAETARRLHIRRPTLYRAIEQLRSFFEAAGFRKKS